MKISPFNFYTFNICLYILQQFEFSKIRVILQSISTFITIYFPTCAILFSGNELNFDTHQNLKTRFEERETAHYERPLSLAQCFQKASLTLSKRQILDSSKLKEFADDNFKFDENGRKFFKHVENTVGKGEICSLRVISPFPTVFSKVLQCRHVKTRACLGKG